MPRSIEHAALGGEGRSESSVRAHELAERILRIGRHLEAVLADAITPLDLSATETRCLRLLIEPLSQRRIAVSLGVDEPRMSRLMRSLEEKGYVRRVRDHSDGRVKRAELTDSGTAALTAISSNLVRHSPLPTALPDSSMNDLLRLLTELECSLVTDRQQPVEAGPTWPEEPDRG